MLSLQLDLFLDDLRDSWNIILFIGTAFFCKCDGRQSEIGGNDNEQREDRILEGCDIVLPALVTRVEISQVLASYFVYTVRREKGCFCSIGVCCWTQN